MTPKILSLDPYLAPYTGDIALRISNFKSARKRLVPKNGTLSDFANGHHYFGLHRAVGGWVYREWAPAAEEMYLTGDFNGWDRHQYKLEKKDNGVFEIFIPGIHTLQNGQRYCAIVVHGGQELERIPAYAAYVVQDEKDHSWNAVVHHIEDPFPWTDEAFRPKKTLFIYECHIGMAQQEGKVGTYREFQENVLPRVAALGYSALQIMAIQEHPYYASFGYQVTNFFAASSRFGTPEDLKSLINAAHDLGIAVLLDVVHSHASKNTREGLSEFDGTPYQYFHEGPEGYHPAWDTRCFDYGKDEVVHFLLSNLKFWMEEYHFDGFRFDGVTSMLYHDHGLGTAFGDYKQYFSMNTDTQAVTYLQLANSLIKELNPSAITIAEDTSAMPGLALPVSQGGIGFSFRLAMGEPDMWIKILKERKDEDWDMWGIFYELTNRRPGEPVIGYCESHDQALVGDKTIMFRLCDKNMYTGMAKSVQDPVIDRGIALHKLIRLLTMSLGGEGYLTFMGNEFGHPEWIDFPREGNGWSYHYCRRQWNLVDDPNLKYEYLNEFEKGMVLIGRKLRLFTGKTRSLWTHQGDKVLMYSRGGGVFAFNFDPVRSYQGYFLPVSEPGSYRVLLTSDDGVYGGFGRVAHKTYTAKKQADGRLGFQIYLPARTAIVFQKIQGRERAEKKA